MNDGTTKPLPPGTSSISSIASLTPQQLVRMYGAGNGIFFGESVFWKRHNGILLGKHKWEAEGETDASRASSFAATGQRRDPEATTHRGG
jgi:hypothetical protein